MANNFQEKRREPRRDAGGRVKLEISEGSSLQQIEGVLLDVSAHGFRAQHSYSSFSSGQELRFHHDHGQGVARVVWNRILAGAVETGFFVLSE